MKLHLVIALLSIAISSTYAEETLMAHVNNKEVICGPVNYGNNDPKIFLEHMIDQALLVQYANSKNIKVDKATIDEQIDNQIKSQFDGSKSNLELNLKSRNMTFEQYYDETRDSILARAVKSFVIKQHTKDSSSPTFEAFIASLRAKADIKYN